MMYCHVDFSYYNLFFGWQTSVSRIDGLKGVCNVMIDKTITYLLVTFLTWIFWTYTIHMLVICSLSRLCKRIRDTGNSSIFQKVMTRPLLSLFLAQD